MTPEHNINSEINSLEHSLTDLRKAHDYINESLVVRFFKTGMIWVFEILMYTIFLGGLILLTVTIFNEAAFFNQPGYANPTVTVSDTEAIVALRVLLLLLSVLFLIIGLLLRQIRQKNKKVNYVLGLLNDSIDRIQQPVESIKNTLNNDDKGYTAVP